MNYLNLGCGYRFHPTWTNVNFVSTGDNVIACDLTEGIPFADNTFDVVYHSHVLEHFPKNGAESFLKECYRVLRPQGIVRVVVPDFEEVARTYLTLLEQASSGCEKSAANYEWLLLEWYDTTTRNMTGGQMATYLSQKQIVNEEFVLDRCGREFASLIDFLQQQHPKNQPVLKPESQPKNLFKKLYQFLSQPIYRREITLKYLLGKKDYTALQIGRFRKSGETHQWMYDRYSLPLLLEKCGFKKTIQRTASESYIPNWSSFNLDTEADGTIYRPNSLFVEAMKLLA